MALRADDVDLVRDCRLVERFQAGEVDAFDDLYRRYFDRLRRFCQRRVGDPFEAEEVAQEAFTRAYRAMPDFAGERRFYPWVTVIASRLCVDAHRRRGRATPVAEVDAGVVESDHSDLFGAADREYLARALDQLAPRHREVLRLREHDGWTYQQIAEHYDVSLGTVEALLHRARKALRREFHKIAGDQQGWAAVPGLGWIARRLAGLRTRANLLANDLADVATPLTAKIAAVGIAVGSAAFAGGGATTVVSPQLAASARPEPAVTASAALAAPAEASQVSPLATRPRAGASPAVQGPLRHNDAATGLSASKSDPVKAQVGQALLAANPKQVGTDLATHLANVDSRIQTLGRKEP